MVEESQIIVHEADKPDLVVDLLDVDFLAGEDRAEVYFLPFEADAAALSDCDGPVVEGVLEVRESAIGFCRGSVELGGVPHAESLVRPFLEAIDVPTAECVAFLETFRKQHGKVIEIVVFEGVGHFSANWTGLFTVGYVLEFLELIGRWYPEQIAR